MGRRQLVRCVVKRQRRSSTIGSPAIQSAYSSTTIAQFLFPVVINLQRLSEVNGQLFVTDGSIRLRSPSGDEAHEPATGISGLAFDGAHQRPADSMASLGTVDEQFLNPRYVGASPRRRMPVAQ